MTGPIRAGRSARTAGMKTLAASLPPSSSRSSSPPAACLRRPPSRPRPWWSRRRPRARPRPRCRARPRSRRRCRLPLPRPRAGPSTRSAWIRRRGSRQSPLRDPRRRRERTPLHRRAGRDDPGRPRRPRGAGAVPRPPGADRLGGRARAPRPRLRSDVRRGRAVLRGLHRPHRQHGRRRAPGPDPR